MLARPTGVDLISSPEGTHTVTDNPTEDSAQQKEPDDAEAERVLEEAQRSGLVPAHWCNRFNITCYRDGRVRIAFAEQRAAEHPATFFSAVMMNRDDAQELAVTIFQLLGARVTIELPSAEQTSDENDHSDEAP